MIISQNAEQKNRKGLKNADIIPTMRIVYFEKYKRFSSTEG
jgi:hypothetical protein